MACSEVGTATNSEEEQEEQKLIDVMFLCDEWKSSKGGLSTFNREFAINLAQATTGSMKIHCYVSNSDDRDSLFIVWSRWLVIYLIFFLHFLWTKMFQLS